MGSGSALLLLDPNVGGRAGSTVPFRERAILDHLDAYCAQFLEKSAGTGEVEVPVRGGDVQKERNVGSSTEALGVE